MRKTLTGIFAAAALTLSIGAPAFAGIFSAPVGGTSTTKPATVYCSHTSNGWYNPAIGMCQYPGE
jgi:hypothetical protein